MKSSTFFIIFQIITFVWCEEGVHDVLFNRNNKSHFISGALKGYADIDSHVEYFDQKCHNFKRNLKKSLQNMHECGDVVLHNYNLTLCENVHSYLERCTQDVITVIENCSTNEYKEWPQLIQKMFISVQQYICRTSGESLVELINPCLWEQLTNSNEKLHRCEDKLQTKFDNYHSAPPTTGEFCGFLRDMRECVHIRTEVQCQNEKTKHALMGLYDAFMEPCGPLTGIGNHIRHYFSHKKVL